MAKAIREVYGETIKKYGELNKDIVVLDADVSGSTKSAMFGKEYPDRFYNCGICEYAMMGMAAGMAKSGKIPFVNTFAVFLTTLGSLAARTFMSYSGLPIKMMGAYGGMSDAFDGATHHALEDIAMMRTLPGVNVMVASDAQITDWMVKTAIEVKEPMYIRLSRDAAPDCHPADAKFELGKGMVVREGSDVTIIACGLMVSTAITAAEALAAKGISARVVDMYCIKPMDEAAVVKAASETKAIITIEEHTWIGGLGSMVAQIVCKTQPKKVINLSLPDAPVITGKSQEVFDYYGLNTENLVKTAVELMKDVQ